MILKSYFQRKKSVLNVTELCMIELKQIFEEMNHWFLDHLLEGQTTCQISLWRVVKCCVWSTRPLCFNTKLIENPSSMFFPLRFALKYIKCKNLINHKWYKSEKNSLLSYLKRKESKLVMPHFGAIGLQSKCLIIITLLQQNGYKQSDLKSINI